MSQLRCKPGDLAIVVRSPSGVNLGRIVTCVRLAGEEDYRREQFQSEIPCWVTEEELTLTWNGVQRKVRLAPDAFLRPLRGDGPGEVVEQADEVEA